MYTYYKKKKLLSIEIKPLSEGIHYTVDKFGLIEYLLYLDINNLWFNHLTQTLKFGNLKFSALFRLHTYTSDGTSEIKLKTMSPLKYNLMRQ